MAADGYFLCCMGANFRDVMADLYRPFWATSIIALLSSFDNPVIDIYIYGPGYPPGRGIFVSSTYRLIRDPQRYNLAVPCTHIVGICFQIDNHPFQRHDMTWLVPWASEAGHRPCATTSRQSACRTRFVKDDRVAGGPKPCRLAEPPPTCLRQCNTIQRVDT